MSKAVGKIVVVLVLVGLVTLSWYKWSGDAGRNGLVDLASGNKLMVVNVLSGDQYKDCRIKGSISVPFEQLETFSQQLDPDTELVFYCSNYMCSGSGAAARMFQEKGFKRVWAYEAGMADWYQQGLPVEGACKAAYLQMKNMPVEDRVDDIAIINTNELKEKLGL